MMSEPNPLISGISPDPVQPTAVRVLVIDDESQIGRMLITQLSAREFHVEHALTGQEGLLLAEQVMPDVVLLDLGLPDLDGVEVCRRLRQTSAVPVIFLTVRDDERTKVQALDTGGDDYVTKPFSLPELLARIRAVLRRKPDATSAASTVFASGDLRVDFAARRVTVRGEEVRLTPKEYELLRLFVQHADKTMTHSQLLSIIWGPAEQNSTQYLHVFLRQLRRKLEPDPARPRHFVTEPGVGYRLRTQPVTE